MENIDSLPFLYWDWDKVSLPEPKVRSILQKAKTRVSYRARKLFGDIDYNFAKSLIENDDDCEAAVNAVRICKPEDSEWAKKIVENHIAVSDSDYRSIVTMEAVYLVGSADKNRYLTKIKSDQQWAKKAYSIARKDSSMIDSAFNSYSDWKTDRPQESLGWILEIIENVRTENACLYAVDLYEAKSIDRKKLISIIRAAGNAGYRAASNLVIKGLASYEEEWYKESLETYRNS